MFRAWYWFGTNTVQAAMNHGTILDHAHPISMVACTRTRFEMVTGRNAGALTGQVGYLSLTLGFTTCENYGHTLTR
jgi:predicted membrane channel-forming protein YqfA (hemolysin III family)